MLAVRCLFLRLLLLLKLTYIYKNGSLKHPETNLALNLRWFDYLHSLNAHIPGHGDRDV